MLSLCFLQMTLLSLFFCHKENTLLPCEQHKCWEREEWTWRMPHQQFNICHSALLLAVYKDDFPVETILKLYLKKQDSIVHMHCGVINGYFKIPDIPFALPLSSFKRTVHTCILLWNLLYTHKAVFNLHCPNLQQ